MYYILVMTIFKNKDDLFKSVSFLKGVGQKLGKYLKNKKIERINDLLWHFPYSSTDRSNMTSIDKLEAGKIQTIKVRVLSITFQELEICQVQLYVGMNLVKLISFFNSREDI